MSPMNYAPIRSFWPRAAHPLELLTDRRIAHYARTGHYGKAQQLSQEALDAAFARHTPRAPSKPKLDVSNLF